MEFAKQAAHEAAHGENHGDLQNQSEKVRHQWPPRAAAGAWRWAWNSTAGQVGQFTAESVPASQVDSAFRLTVACRDSSRPQLFSDLLSDPFSDNELCGAMTEARSVVPSR